MGTTQVDGWGAIDHDGTTMRWFVADHWEQSYGVVRQDITGAAMLALRTAAKDDDHPVFTAALEAAVGSTYWAARSSTWKTRMWAAFRADVAYFP
jgi:hypothetical protein